MDLEGLIAIFPIPILQVGDHILPQLLEALILQNHHRTDSHNAEHTAQSVHCLVKIKVSLGLDIDTALLLGYTELSFHLF